MRRGFRRGERGSLSSLGRQGRKPEEDEDVALGEDAPQPGPQGPGESEPPLGQSPPEAGRFYACVTTGWGLPLVGGCVIAQAAVAGWFLLAKEGCRCKLLAAGTHGSWLQT